MGISLGATLPSPPPQEEKKPEKSPEPEPVPPKETEKMEEEEVVESDPESEVDLDMTGVIEPDTDEPQEMGNLSDDVELTDEQMDEFNTKRGEAMSAFSEAEWQKAIDLFTEAIKVNSGSAAVYAKRGTYLKTGKPNACIRDCDRAIKL